MANLPQLTIPQPCSQNWAAMTPAGGGRYCGQCQKIVVDFTGLSDAELLEWMQGYKGDACGRFRAGQLGRPLVPPRRRPWAGLRLFLTVTIPALLFSLKSTATVRPHTPAVTAATQQQPVMTAVADTFPKIIIKGSVHDENGAPVPFAAITEKGTRNYVTADANGDFTIALNSNRTLIASAYGYATTLLKVKNAKRPVAFVLNHETLMGDVYISAPVQNKVPRQPRKEKGATEDGEQ